MAISHDHTTHFGNGMKGIVNRTKGREKGKTRARKGKNNEKEGGGQKASKPNDAALRRAWTTAMQFLPGRRSPQLTLYSVC